MLLRSLPHLHYPITVTGLLVKPGEDVKKNTPIFSYFYKSTVEEYDAYGEAKKVEKNFPARYDTHVEGTIVRWNIAKGTVINTQGVDLVEINEPCQHPVQFGGMCAVCFKDMTEVDYGTSVPDHARASVSVAHSDQALRVTRTEAQRTETAAKRRLLEAKKLSLVVDLDQTIIHATVDPTVGEWMEDETNPNHEAVKHVRRFQLEDEGPGHNCWYYVKMRPGLAGFLQRISRIFELHIYTMGTRAYAKNVAKIVDPNKRIFGDRILSRDENGSLTAKSLHRLFPVDTSMVVIIDDRGDVWDWSKSLIKVVPYDFFKGIGDINSSFLPKRQDILPEAPPTAPPTVADSPNEVEVEEQSTAITAEDAKADDIPQPDTPSKVEGESSTIEKLMSMGGASDEAAMKEKATQQDEQLADQIANRPLLQQQLQLDKSDEEALEALANGTRYDPSSTYDSDRAKPKHNLLKDDDSELEHLERVLTDLHETFYDIYRDSVKGTVGGGRIAQLKGERSPNKKRPDMDMSLVPDVQEIMPGMKADVLKGCNIVFSGVIPISPKPESHDIWRWAASFGASISTEVSKYTTHVVGTRERFTGKMSTAARMSRIKIVSLDWLTEACRSWMRPDEEPYLIPVEPSKKSKARVETPETSESETEATLGLFTDPEWLSKQGAAKAEDDDDDDGEASPIDDLEDDEWAKMAKEFDDEDISDSGSETGSQAGDDGRKRKRSSDRESDAESQNGGNESDTGSLKARGRPKGKRRQLGRTSSLSHVTTLLIKNPEADVGSSPVTNGAGEEVEGDDDIDDFEAELQKALAEED